MLQEHTIPSPELTKAVEASCTPTIKAATLVNNKEDPLTTEESKPCKPVDSAVNILETKEVENAGTSSVSPMETDPLSTEKEESSAVKTTEESTNSMKTVENEATPVSVKNPVENNDISIEKSSHENIQEAKPSAQTETSKLNNDPVSIFLLFFKVQDFERNSFFMNTAINNNREIA